MTIKAPFNFVPVSDTVFYPEWADCISHDVPFEDGVSGSIRIKITAKTPIFVRNGHTKKDAAETNDSYKSFSNDCGKYFIPGTSIKGAIRNVFEIMSFGKMKTQETHKFLQREWDNEKVYTLKKEQGNIKAGWLHFDGNEYYVVPCSDFYRISHKNLDAFLGKELFEQNYSEEKGDKKYLNKSQKDKEKKEIGPKTAYYKYVELLERNGVSFNNLQNLNFVTIPGKNGKNVRFDDAGGRIKGSIVLTGQPGLWKYPRPETHRIPGGKFYEFVFEYSNTNSTLSIPQNVIEDFLYGYKASKDWEYLEPHLKDTGVPVFFRQEQHSVKDMGLAYLYKLPFEKVPAECIPESHVSDRHDLAECVFGFISKDEKNCSLKGRVQFGHAWAKANASPLEKNYVLATPKASYYPIYAKNGDNWNEANQISGRKRYINRQKPYENSAGSAAMTSCALVLPQNSEFNETITFHNLKKVELGALLSALTFHGSKDCLHSLGQGKPFGWGSILIEIENLEVSGEYVGNEFAQMDCFERFMAEFLGSKWLDQEPITQLFALSTPIPERYNDRFSYMSLDNKEFQNGKGNDRLRRFTEIVSPLDIKLNQGKSVDKIAKELIDEILKARKDEKDALLKKLEEGKEKIRLAQQEAEQEKQKIAAKLVSMNLSFLAEKNTFKEGKAAIENKFKQADLGNISSESICQIPEEAQKQIKEFVERMFARPDKKWGGKDMAKVAAEAEIKKWGL